MTDFPDVLTWGYDQGIGRSIWYTYKGDIENVTRIISGFPKERQAGLWRGLGIAVACAGGCNADTYKSLLALSGEQQLELIVGGKLAAKSRYQANAITMDVELACDSWCNSSLKEAVAMAIKYETIYAGDGEDAFEIWISKIKK